MRAEASAFATICHEPSWPCICSSEVAPWCLVNRVFVDQGEPFPHAASHLACGVAARGAGKYAGDGHDCAASETRN